MPVLNHLEMRSVRDEIEHWLNREREEREAAERTSDICAKDAHLVMAERYADRAHILNEALPQLPAISSGLWKNVSKKMASPGSQRRGRGEA